MLGFDGAGKQVHLIEPRDSLERPLYAPPNPLSLNRLRKVAD